MDRTDVEVIDDEYWENRYKKTPDLEVTLHGTDKEVDILKRGLMCLMGSIANRNAIGVKVFDSAPEYSDVERLAKQIATANIIGRNDIRTYKDDDISNLLERFKGAIEKDKIGAPDVATRAE
ncbi:MAG TPA: hypothetical protein VMR51_01120 [Patescibacteria group bacterium]|nr:hypothetical protein [Patescibacteria group bacterium]